MKQNSIQQKLVLTLKGGIRSLLFVSLIISSGSFLLYPVAAKAQTFTLTGPMNTARTSHTATLLPDGKVLIAGGRDYIGSTAVILATAELYDPNTGTFTPTTGSMSIGRVYHQATLLPDGKVLIAGGGTGSQALASAELYDPNTGTFTLTGSMSFGRIFHTVTLLPNGKVLVAGGVNSNPASPIAELYDPNTGTFTPTTGSMIMGRIDHTATLLDNGKVLVAGGFIEHNPLTDAELYDPDTETFTSTGSMITARRIHTATLLPDGKVLVAGGIPSLASAELYDPETETFTSTGWMSTVRVLHTATLLPDGKVLVAGGAYLTYLDSAELYVPGTGTFTSTGSMSIGRIYHTATLLPNGKVLVAGGNDSSGTSLYSAELYNGALTPEVLLQQQIDLVTSYNLKQGISNSLDVKLQNAVNALKAEQENNLARACSLMTSFMYEVEAQRGESLTTSQADALLALALQVKQAMGCK